MLNYSYIIFCEINFKVNRIEKFENVNELYMF